MVFKEGGTWSANGIPLTVHKASDSFSCMGMTQEIAVEFSIAC